VPYAYGGSKYARNPPVPPEVRTRASLLLARVHAWLGSARSARLAPACISWHARADACGAFARAWPLQIHVVHDFGRDMAH
jgi:hypothetical protein